VVGHERIHAMAEVRLDRTRVVTVIGELVAAGMAQHVGRLRLLLALHWGVPHDLFNACLIHREL